VIAFLICRTGPGGAYGPPVHFLSERRKSATPSRATVLERFEDAWQRRVFVAGFPVCHSDDIIASKVAANRVKDQETLGRLRSFRNH
jgi:hypothetical protein